MQIKMKLNGGRHGGRRAGSGRTRKKSKGVAHRVREKINHRTPMHVNFKYRIQVRNKETLRLLKKSVANARKHGLRNVLRTVRETRNALMYVLFNQQKHEKGIYSTIDEYSSVLCFADGLDFIRKFAIRNKMILKVQRSVWIPDDPTTWLTKMALHQMKRGAEAPL